MVFFISILNLILNIFGSYSSYRRNSILVLFWIGLAFFISIPLFVDSFMILINKAKEWEVFLFLQDENHDFSFEKTNMILMSLYILLFNIFFLIGERFSNIKVNLKEIKIDKIQFERFLLLLNYIFFFIFLLNFNGEWFVADFNRDVNFYSQISVIFICICTSATYVLGLTGHKFLAILNLLPAALVSFITSERPYLAPVIGVCFLLLIANKKNLIKPVIFGFIALFLFRGVRAISNDDKASIISMFFSRDSATSVLYYVFQNPNYYSGLTEAKASIFMLSTGLIPTFIWNERNFSLVDIPAILAQDRFGWAFGTIHPSLHGWVYVDLGWFGLVFALILGFALSKLNEISAQYSLRMYSISIVAISMFIFVGLRGSLQVGYSKAFYIFFIGILIFYFYKILIKAFPRKA